MQSGFHHIRNQHRLGVTEFTYPAAPEVTTWHYNVYGQLAAKEYADASRVEYSYNAYGQMTARKWARDRVTGYGYDNAGRLASVSYDGEDTENISYGYDQRGRLAEVTDVAGVHAFTYNTDGTVAAESLPQAGDSPLRRGYDALGRPAELRLGEAGTTYICFNNDAVRCIRRITETATEIKLEFAMGAWAERESLTYQPLNTVYRYNGTDYDDFGRPSSHPHYQKHRERLAPYLILETQPAGINWDGGYRVAYSYDGMGRLAAAGAFGQSAAYSRVPGSNRLNTTEFSSGAAPVHTATRSYDDFNRLTGVNGYGYTLNDKDQRTKLTLPDGQYWDYAYDDLGQVTSGVKQTAAAALLASHTYAYDTIGNRENATMDAVETEYTANNLNQYTAINAETPTYDADGNMLTNGEWSYRWNAENRLIAAESTIVKLEYAYDYMGRRFRKTLYTKDGTAWTLQRTTTFVYDGYKQIAELTDNTATMYTVWQPPSSGDFDVPLWTKTGKAVRTHIPDGNKNIRQLKDTTGTAVASLDYDPFGTPTATGQTTPWQFSSEYRDLETGLVYYNYRYYNPQLGRWINRDPIEEKGGENLYSFTHNSAISKYDLNGTREITIVLYYNTTAITPLTGVYVSEIVNECKQRCDKCRENDINFRWIYIPELREHDDSVYKHLPLGPLTGAFSGKIETYGIAIIDDSSLGTVGYNNGPYNSINIDKIKNDIGNVLSGDPSRGSSNVYDYTLAAVIVHEAFYHGISGTAGHHEKENYVDSRKPKVSSPNSPLYLSSSACDRLCNVLDLWSK